MKKIFAFFFLFWGFSFNTLAEDFCKDKQFKKGISNFVTQYGLNGKFVKCNNALAGPVYESSDGSIHTAVMVHNPGFIQSVSKQRAPLLCLIEGNDGKIHKEPFELCDQYMMKTMNMLLRK